VTKSTYPTLREIRDTHAWKREYERYLPLSRYVFRPLGFLLTWLAIRLGLASETVSWISGFVALIGCLCLMSSQEQLLLIGISLLIFFNLLDCVDGSIARTMKTENPYGSFLDSVMAWVDIGLWALIGFMAYRHPQLLYWHNPFDKGEIVWLITGGITCYFYNLVSYTEGTFDRLLREGVNKLFNKTEPETAKGNVTENKTDTLSLVKNIVQRINHNLRVRETYLFLLIIAFFGRVVDLLLIFFLFYFVLHTALLVFIYCRRGRQLRKSHLQEPL
jgi:hypothetical protein